MCLRASVTLQDKDGYSAFQHAFFNGRVVVLCVLATRLAARSWLLPALAAALAVAAALLWRDARLQE